MANGFRKRLGGAWERRAFPVFRVRSLSRVFGAELEVVGL